MSSSSQATLLVVDDEEMNRDMLSRRLEIEGFTVATAADGPEALRLLAERDFDLVLLDVMMPGQNGYQVLAEIRKTRSVLDLPVLMATAKSQNEDMVTAFEVGANDYITKPINFPVALARINSHLASKQLSTKLRESETRYALSAQGANDGLWDWNLVTGKIHYSKRWKSMLGYGEEEISDSPDEWLSRVHPDDLPHVQQCLALHRTGRTEQFESEHRMLQKDETYCWVLTRGVAIWDSAGRESRMAGSQTDITRGKAADPLTALPNRVLFKDHLEAAGRGLSQQSEAPFAVLFIDLDRFKVVNDSLGHHAGDELLVTVARRLEACLRASDVVTRFADRCTIARFGGDEFVILLKGITDESDACHVADRILKVCSEPIALKDHTVSVSASIGIAIGPRADDSADALLRDADTAMYHAKKDGKGRWCLFDPAMRTLAVARLVLETDLKRGMDQNEFRVFYQPIVAIASGRIEGFEALIRWQHSTRGLVPPMEFISVAEETGLIVELGAWVLEQSCRQLHIWQVQYPERGPLFVSVNVSSVQFADPSFVERVANCLERTEINAKCLRLEITETAIMRNLESATKMLEQLRKLGVHISLDDFGTGHSSLSYLQQFPIDTLKIDRSFIQRLGRCEEALEIVRTIIKLAHSLGMEVTAEGIEEFDHHSTLDGFDCELGQGFLYSRPGTPATIEKLFDGKSPDLIHKQDAPAALPLEPDALSAMPSTVTI